MFSIFSVKSGLNLYRCRLLLAIKNNEIKSLKKENESLKLELEKLETEKTELYIENLKLYNKNKTNV